MAKPIHPPHHFDHWLGKRLRQERLMAGMTQAELARAVQISPQQIQKYESGRNRISVERLIQIASILRSSIIKILNMPTDNNRNTMPSEPYSYQMRVAPEGNTHIVEKNYGDMETRYTHSHDKGSKSEQSRHNNGGADTEGIANKESEDSSALSLALFQAFSRLHSLEKRACVVQVARLLGE